MCRWAAYIGRPIYLEDVICRPGHSLVRQSHGAQRCHTAVNADGVGLAWYGDRPEPGQYRDVMPAWSDSNLRSLTATLKSHLFLAHVRASTGTATSRNNCHPFVVGKWSFMHNGQFGGYDSYRRHADALIPDDYYQHRKGATDSEALFLMALAEGLETDPAAAMSRATAKFETLARDRGTAPHVRLTAAFSDGQRLYALRYASDDHAPTLYHRWSDTRGGRAVVSEPLESDEEGWQEIPAQSFCVFQGDSLTVTPFNPAALRAAA
ncbi:class II glutamine amidotransferase [Paracoccus shanxieyensis]|uniref:Class II glutamine amidotransferase n=1 Tax=Paracoccus shanxieyensis TaxID=2675752 RepID=A0A6L6J2E0_9RHOB|nr:class II glutamine amidotransferase [Paracoccus shanxieyensis]MTH64944.1 class II glutamine amidotransferase [Paracoccus shanxieyensis]MTH88152.1 class II glutamine amidotransferase [Paracoccus shanxieyensis]